MENKVTSNVTKGLVLSLILIVLSLVAYFTNSEQSAWNKWVSNIIFFGGVIWACITYANQMNNNVTYGNVFGHGFKTTAVVTVILIIFTVIFLLVFPDVKDKAIDTARQKMEEQHKLSDEQIDTALNITKKFFYAFAIGGILIAYLIIGTVASLIGAAVAKKNPVTPFENQV